MSVSYERRKDRTLCYVPGCGSRSHNELGISFHAFPKPGSREVTIHNAYGIRERVDLSYAWKKVLCMQWKLPNHAKVCSRHFVKDDFFHYGKNRLKRNAVPSTNLPYSLTRRQVNNSLCEARKERLLKRKKQKLEQMNKGQSSSDIISHNKDIEASGDVNEIALGHIEKLSHQEELSHSVEESHKEIEPSCVEIGVQSHKEIEPSCVEIGVQSHKEIEPSCVEIGVQVKTGFFTFLIVDYIKSDSDLKCATGLESMKHLDMIVKEIDNAIKGKRLKIHSRIGIRKQIILTLIKLKHNLNYTFLRLLFQSYSPYHCRNMFVEMLGILGTLNFGENSVQKTLNVLLQQANYNVQDSNDEI